MSILDIGVVAIVLISGLVAFSMGFVRVVLGLLGWVGAAFATLYGFSYVRPFAQQWISVGFLADAAAGLASPHLQRPTARRGVEGVARNLGSRGLRMDPRTALRRG